MRGTTSVEALHEPAGIESQSAFGNAALKRHAFPTFDRPVGFQSNLNFVNRDQLIDHAHAYPQRTAVAGRIPEAVAGFHAAAFSPGAKPKLHWAERVFVSG